MDTDTIRQRLDRYVKEKYGIEPERLPFGHEDYSIYRHTDEGKWFAVLIVKPRHEFGLVGEGDSEVVSVMIRDPLLVDLLTQQPGYLRGYPSRRWNWLSVLLDGTVPFEDICRWLDESYAATAGKKKRK